MPGRCAWLTGSAAGPGEAEPCSRGTAPCTRGGRSRVSGLGRGRLTSRRKSWHVGSSLPCGSTQAVLSTGQNHETQHPTCLPDVGGPTRRTCTCTGAVPSPHHLRWACSSHRCRHRCGAAVCASGGCVQLLQGSTHRNEAENMSPKSTAVPWAFACDLLPRLPDPPGHCAGAPARQNVVLSSREQAAPAGTEG